LGTTSLEKGISLYGEGRWGDAVAELRKAHAESEGDNIKQADILSWISLAEIGAGEYEEAIKDLDEITAINPNGAWNVEIPYYKGRCLYHLGEFDEAIISLKSYADAVSDPMKKASSFYWVGECLFSLGQFDLAQDVFYRVIDDYPQSVKYEAANYRIALIDQKKVEAELLAILKWSHEESLKTVEAYQRRERSYDQAIIAYQKRITDMQNNQLSQVPSE
ncbi:MAG: tetratricopeptide repeat protein, partial [Treponema sp.]|nr:tetratricopeptide repeat protein [Treponema sp.]